MRWLLAVILPCTSPPPSTTTTHLRRRLTCRRGRRLGRARCSASCARCSALSTGPGKCTRSARCSGWAFDRPTEIALLGISSIQAAKGTSLWLVVTFPLLFFTAGMCLIDTVDGVTMLGLYVLPQEQFGGVAVADDMDAERRRRAPPRRLRRGLPPKTAPETPSPSCTTRLC